MNDMISVIIPVYNREKYIEECVASLQAQSYSNLEIILIDDGSTDNTLEVCKKLAAADSRIVLLDGGHGGVSAARNKGLDVATGKYVLFVDSDDVAHPLLLEELLNAMHNSDANVGGTMVYDISEKRWHKVQTHIANSLTLGGFIYKSHVDTLQEIFTTDCAFSIIPGTIMRRDWIGTTRFREDLSIGEDFYFIYQNLIKNTGTVSLEHRRYYCRTHASNTSWDFGYDGFRSRFLRRELVWKSEEAMGRTEYANLQKQQGFGCYLLCLKQNTPLCEDVDRMRQTMRSYRPVLWPALSWKDKLRYYCSVYTPGFYLMIFRLKDKIKK